MNCPSEETFVDVLGGRADAAAAAMFHRHVGGCDTCSALLRAMAVAAPSVAGHPGLATTASNADEGFAPAAIGPLAIGPGAVIYQYELIRELGRGGMGMVWAARDTKLGRRVAIKFLLNASRGVAERFLVEARATAQCSHENIVIIHEVAEIEQTPFMVLEFLEGQTLRDVISSFGVGNPVPPSRVVELVLPVARALARAHENGIVHRDLKPENVFVTNAGQVKVLDFGIAKALGSIGRASAEQLGNAAPAMNLTREGALVGTLPYMSPEQMGADQVDHRADLWAVGIMMFEMLAGRHPIQPFTMEALFTNAASPDAMPSIAAAVLDLPDGLTTLVDHCLRKRKDERLAGAAELVAQLEALLPGRHGRALAEGESPYPGLTAFQEADADRFFGRTHDVARMVTRIRERPVTGIVGPSGVGKSSFVRAGVGPALKASGERWSVITLRPGRQPLAALARAVHRTTSRSGPALAEFEETELEERLRESPGLAGTSLRERARRTGPILLFVDQFEELYTLVPDVVERRMFTAALAAIADDATAPVRVVVSMRSDFLDRIAEDKRFMEELSRGLVFLPPPDREGLREALVAPIEMIGHRFESSAMVEDMLEALEGTPGALPLLQFAAAKLWEARDRKRRLLTVASYNAIGGISGALATHADEVVAAMDPAAQRLTQKIFRRLVTPERTRAIVELADLDELAPDGAELARTIDQLVAARLLVVQTRGDGGGGSVEIVHESLIDRWPTLRRWLDDDHEDTVFLAQLAGAAKQWDTKGRPAGLVWRGEAMEEARRWHALRPRELPARDRAYLDAVFALAQRSRRIRRTILIGSFALLAAIAAGASIAFVWIRGAEQNATEQATRAESEKDRAEVQKSRAETEAENARQATRLAEDRLAQVNKEHAAKQRAEDQVQEKGHEVEMTKEELKAALAKAEREKALAQDESKKARDAALAAHQAEVREKQAKDEAQRMYLVEKRRADDAEKMRSKISTELPK